MSADADLFRRLRRRLALVVACIIAAILVALLGGVMLVMDQVLLAQQSDALQAAAQAAGHEIDFGEGSVKLRPDPDEAGTIYLVWGPRGDLLAATDNTSADPFAPAARAAMGGVATTSQVQVQGATGPVTFLVVSEPIRAASAGGVIQAARSLAPIRSAEARLMLLVWTAVGIGILLAGAAGWYLAGRALRPIQVAFQRQREFTADASHELRTPLAVIDAGLQLLARHPERSLSDQAATLAAMRTQTARMRRLVSDLLALARVDAGAADPVTTTAVVDLDALIDESVAAFQPLAAERQATLRTVRHEGGELAGAPDQLGQAVGALVHNALEHGGPGVRVELGSWREGDRAVLEVADDGPGIGDQDQERLMARFSRGDPARSRGGSGLGLAIARGVAAAHGGVLTLAAAHPGTDRPGLRACLILPLRRGRG